MIDPAPGFTAQVLLETEAPEREALAAWLTERLGDAATVTVRGDAVVVRIGGGDSIGGDDGNHGAPEVVVRPVDAPVAGDGPASTVHPVFWRGDTTPVSRHRSHVEVSTEGSDPRAARLALGYPLGSIAAIPGAVAVHDPAAGATWPAEVYADLLHTCLAQELVPGALWASVWLDRPEPGRPVSGRTVGLTALGHPELVVTDSDAGVQPVYEVLSRLVDAVAAGATLPRGRTVPVGERRVQVSPGPDPAGSLRVALEQ